MRIYELTYIVPDKIEEKEIPKVSERVKKLLPDGKIIKEEFWGRRKLAYPILKNNFGYYTTLVFETEPENIEKMTIKLKLDEDVIRHLIVGVKEVKKVKEAKKEEKVEKPKQKPEKLELPKIKVKAKPKKIEKPKKAKLTEEIETEEKKMKALEEKLEEILKK